MGTKSFPKPPASNMYLRELRVSLVPKIKVAKLLSAVIKTGRIAIRRNFHNADSKRDSIRTSNRLDARGDAAIKKESFPKTT
jgi:hypothetical protein